MRRAFEEIRDNTTKPREVRIFELRCLLFDYEAAEDEVSRRIEKLSKALDDAQANEDPDVPIVAHALQRQRDQMRELVDGEVEAERVFNKLCRDKD